MFFGVRRIPARVLQASQLKLRFSSNSSAPDQGKSGFSNVDRGFTPVQEHSAELRKTLDKIIRVDQAGETAALWIYRGQNAVLGKDPKLNKLLK
ncbi:hypothetical protein BB560_000923 [Smittium megazygosporum]|uniref:Uncharacterized protein n=1 Tax=Smittium megazygosporum TaxID=133381 RepID=A0A2T9ZJ19_9FUNG|nr:hypothetical protein BB560_000923 [Smittium megazygosporum]